MSEQPLTIWGAEYTKERNAAIKRLITGKTPVKEVRTRTVRGGDEARYVNTYYMTREISLITGFRWKSECLQEKFRPDETNPVEVGAFMKVTIWDNDGREYSHTSWGSREVKRYSKDDPSGKGNYKKGDIISLFDDFKSAYSDGIKKCLSYFGIANDIYGGKDLDYFGEEADAGDTPTQTANMNTSPDAANAFMKYIGDKHVLPSKACEILGISNLSEVTDWRDAYNKIKAVVEK